MLVTRHEEVANVDEMNRFNIFSHIDESKEIKRNKIFIRGMQSNGKITRNIGGDGINVFVTAGSLESPSPPPSVSDLIYQTL